MMPIINYTIIKAQPKWFFSICKFMEIYLGDLKKKKEDNQLTQLRGICENMIIVNNESLNDVSEEEFQRKSEDDVDDDGNVVGRHLKGIDFLKTREKMMQSLNYILNNGVRVVLLLVDF